jgi:hypothetical protein
MKIVRRGYLPIYEKLFKGEGLEKIKEAAKDCLYLLNRGYKVKTATCFVQNHYMLEENQRLALARSLATDKDIKERKKKELRQDELAGKEVWIDGFNAIIPMESLLSDSPLFVCMDGAIRDMANLKGSYRIIDKTEGAIRLILEKLDELNIRKAHIHIDRPVSNSGRLKMLILEISKEYNVDVDVELLDAVDKSLYDKECVISGDCVVIDKSISWIPLYKWIIEDYEKKHDVWKVFVI